MKNTRISRINNGVQLLFWLLCCSFCSFALAQQDEFPRIVVTNGDGDTQITCIQDVPANLSVLDGEVVLTASALQDDFGCPEPNAVIIAANTFQVSEDLPDGNANGDGIAQANEDLLFEADLIGAGLTAADISCQVTGPAAAFPAGIFPIDAIVAPDPFGGPGDFLLQATATLQNDPPTMNNAVFTLDCIPASSTNGMSSDTTTIDIMGVDPDLVRIVSFGATPTAVSPGDTVTFTYTLDFEPSTITDAACEISAPANVLITSPVAVPANDGPAANTAVLTISAAAPLQQNAVFTLTCTTGGNADTDTALVDIEDEPPPPGFDCSAPGIAPVAVRDTPFTFEEEFNSPWPGGLRGVSVINNRFLALQFDGTDTTATGGLLDYDRNTSGGAGQGSAFVTLSPCVGHFGNFTNYDEDCIAAGIAGSIPWSFGPSGTEGDSDNTCSFPRTQQMFLNIVFGSTANPNVTTCIGSSSCTIDIGVARQRQ